MGDQDQSRSELLEQLAEARRHIDALEQALAESQRAERSLREQDQWDRAFLKDFKGIAFRGKIDFSPLMAAGAVEEITGYLPEDFLSGRRRWDDIVYPEDLANLGETIEKVRTIPDYSTNVEYRLCRKDGELRWVHEVLHNICDASGKPAFVQGLLYDVHAHKLAQEELARNKAILEATVECVPFDFFVIGADGHYKLQNAVCRANWGRLIGHTPEAMAPTEEIRAIWLENNRRAFAGEKVEGEVTFHVNGEKRSIYNVLTPIRDGSRVYGVLGVNIDFSKRRQAEEQLRQSEERYRQLAESTPDMVYIVDREGRLLYANRSAAACMGRSVQAIVGKTQEDLFAPELAKRHSERVRQVFATGKANETNELYCFPASEMWLNVRSIPLRDEQGNVTAMMGLCRDFTARVQAEEAIRKAHDELEDRVRERTAELAEANARLQREVEERTQAQKALRESEERFRSYFVQGLIGMGVSKADGQWRDVNDRLCQILGYSREELQKKKWFEITHPDDLETGLSYFNRMLAGEIDHYTYDKRYVRKDGNAVDTAVFVKSFRRQDGTVDHMLALIEDITERHRAQEALERERRTLEHMLRASDHERQLIAYDIHDGLAQYLTGAIMHLQITDHLRQRKPAEAAKAFEAGMAMVRESLNEARRLISGVRPPILDESGVVAAVAHLVYDFRANQGPEIEFRSDVNFGRLAPILENAIYRIAQEGLTNACKYSQSENIRVELVQLGDQVRIEIADQGVGFDPQTVDEGRFGLEGIRERARLLGGSALIESAPGKGTRIVVEVPLVPRKEHGG